MLRIATVDIPRQRDSYRSGCRILLSLLGWVNSFLILAQASGRALSTKCRRNRISPLPGQELLSFTAHMQAATSMKAEVVARSFHHCIERILDCIARCYVCLKPRIRSLENPMALEGWKARNGSDRPPEVTCVDSGISSRLTNIVIIAWLIHRGSTPHALLPSVHG